MCTVLGRDRRNADHHTKRHVDGQPSSCYGPCCLSGMATPPGKRPIAGSFDVPFVCGDQPARRPGVAAALLLLIGGRRSARRRAHRGIAPSNGKLPPYGTNGKGNPRTTTARPWCIRGIPSTPASDRRAARRGLRPARRLPHANRAPQSRRHDRPVKRRRENQGCTGHRGSRDARRIHHRGWRIRIRKRHHVRRRAQRILRNLINGRQLVYEIRCIQGSATTLSSRTTR